MSKHSSRDYNQQKDAEDTRTGTGTGGQSGSIHFRYHDIYSSHSRDDLLPMTEIQRLLAVEGERHKALVVNQKHERQQRKKLKNLPQNYHAGIGYRAGGQQSPYKAHPITQRAQFSGMDKQVTTLPSENAANTNSDVKEALENRLEQRLQQRMQYRSTPKLRPF